MEDYGHGDDTAEQEDTCRAHSGPSDIGGDDREELPGCAVDEENDTFSPSDALDDVSTFKATGLDTIASLADRQDNDLDPEVSAQHEQAKEQAYFLLREEKGKGKAKGKGKFLVRSSCLPLENRRQRLK